MPFENISKVLLGEAEGAGRATTLSEFLDGIELSDLGGTCFSSNPFLVDLLRELGYEADLLGADMSVPDMHTCVQVRVDAVPYHVDVGFAAPFREPFSLVQLPAQILEGGKRYLLEIAAEKHGHRMSVFSGSSGTSAGFSYLVHQPPRTLEFFAQAIQDSYLPTSKLMNQLWIGRVFADSSLDLIGRRLFCHQGGQTTVSVLNSVSEIKAALANQFHMPRAPVQRAVEAIERLSGAPYFEAVT